MPGPHPKHKVFALSNEFDVVARSNAESVADGLWHCDLALTGKPSARTIRNTQVSTHVEYISWTMVNVQVVRTGYAAVGWPLRE